MTHEELKEYLKETYGGYAMFEPEEYDEGIIGITENGNLVYSYDGLAEALILHDGMTYEEAMEWIDYNTIRTIPYMGEFKPVVVIEIPDCEDEWLIGVSSDSEPVYSCEHVPDGPVTHECLADYLVFGDDEEEKIPGPIIVYPIKKD